VPRTTSGLEISKRDDHCQRKWQTSKKGVYAGAMPYRVCTVISAMGAGKIAARHDEY